MGTGLLLLLIMALFPFFIKLIATIMRSPKRHFEDKVNDSKE